MAENKSKPTKGKKTVASTLGYCKECGSFYQVPAGEPDPGNCGKKSCIEKAANINRIETPTTSGVTIVEFSSIRPSDDKKITKKKVSDNMYVMDVTKEHVYSLKELEEMENAKKEKKSKTTKKVSTKKVEKGKPGRKPKKANTKRVSKKQ